MITPKSTKEASEQAMAKTSVTTNSFFFMRGLAIGSSINLYKLAKINEHLNTIHPFG
jgi:hypothetical protein